MASWRLAEALDEPVETDGTDWPAALGNGYLSGNTA
jgi:hypothetical protein